MVGGKIMGWIRRSKGGTTEEQRSESPEALVEQRDGRT